MSIVSVNVHLHDGELAKLAAYFVDGYVSAAQCILKKFAKDGDYERAHRRHLEAVRNMALMMKFLTPAQKRSIEAALVLVKHRQLQLLNEDADLTKRERIKKYKQAVKAFDGLIKMTSDAVAEDLGLNRGDAEAYHMALACTDADVDAIEMMDEVIGMFKSADTGEPKGEIVATAFERCVINQVPDVSPKGKDVSASKEPNTSKKPKSTKDLKRTKPQQEPKPSTSSKQRSRKGKHQADTDRVPAVLMGGMAQRLKHATIA
ncbi:hypothetical protein PILCRDRAFT_10768 [Piloderma croceum F 1598]|uniref:Uncharacterized protein n=1 Tax=Piloderma croceum (strain F 1598) TaxID=765440 RepID=A0A0C3FG72_PILCF|nr:hypothetical protein PILCRDRAFT_10768 [Piloderma croceum F 1598]